MEPYSEVSPEEQACAAPDAVHVANVPALSQSTPPSVCISAISFLLGLLCLSDRYSLPPLARSGNPSAADYAFVYCMSVALIALYIAGVRRGWKLHPILRSPLLVVPVAGSIAAAIYKLGMHQFGGFDESLIVHAASCYAHGLKPFADFPCSMPPFFMAAIRAGVRLFGLRWASLMLLPTSFAAVTSLWLFVLLRRIGIDVAWALAVTIAVQVSTMVSIPFWWYNNTSYIATVLLIASVLACLQQEAPATSWISVALSLALVMTCKPNGAIAGLAMLALFATAERRWAKALAACLAAAALAWLVCGIAQMPLAAIVQSYAEVGKLRGSPLKLTMLRGVGYYFRYLIYLNLFGFCIALVTCARKHPQLWRQYLVAVVAALTCLEMLCTNAEWKYCDLSVLLVATAFLCLRPWQREQASVDRKTLLVTLLAFSTVTAGFLAILHVRIFSIGAGAFYEPLPTTRIQSGFFSGLEAGPRLQRVMAQTRQVLDQLPAQKVFFGPRMQFEYAVFGQAPLAGMPLLWDEGNLYAPERTPELLLNFQQQDPDLLIFLKNDYTHMGAMGYYISHSHTYERIDSFRDLTVYVRRKSVPVTSVKLASAQR